MKKWWGCGSLDYKRILLSTYLPLCNHYLFSLMLLKITELSPTENKINADIQNNFYFFYRKRSGPIKWFFLKQMPNTHNHSLDIILLDICNYIHISYIWVYNYIHIHIYILKFCNQWKWCSFRKVYWEINIAEQAKVLFKEKMTFILISYFLSDKKMFCASSPS